MLRFMSDAVNLSKAKLPAVDDHTVLTMKLVYRWA